MACPRADPALLPLASLHAGKSPWLSAWGRDGARGVGKEPSHPRWDVLLPSAGTAAGFPGRPLQPSAGWGAARGALIRLAALGPAAARPGRPGAVLSPGKKMKVTGTSSGAAPFLSCPIPALPCHRCRRGAERVLPSLPSTGALGCWHCQAVGTVGRPQAQAGSQHGGFPASCKVCTAEMAFLQAAAGEEEKPGWAAVGKER